MSDTTHDDHPPAHEPDEAGHGHAGHDEHGDHGPALGPIDWAAWGAGVVGVGAGLVVAVCLYITTALG
jgi:hypothetical protein